MADSKKISSIFLLCIVIGAITFAVGIFGQLQQRTWIAYMVNLVFWSGLAQGAVVFTAAYRITNGSWGRHVGKIAQGFLSFIPLTVVFFLLTFFGRHYLWSWIDHPIPEKAFWLDETFFYLRVTGYFSILAVISWIYVKALRNTDESKLSRLTPVFLIVYALCYSMVGFDVVMTLDPHWYSTLYGWLYFVHAFFAGVAGILLVSVLVRKPLGLEEQLGPKQLYDMSRLLMGFSMLSGGLYWAQFLVIWYGNLGEETSRLIIRFHTDPWTPIQWTVIAILYFFPLVIFLSRSIKEKPKVLIVISSIILLGLWLYQYIEIVPAIWKGQTAPLGFIEAGITLGFLGICGLCWLASARQISFTQSSAVSS